MPSKILTLVNLPEHDLNTDFVMFNTVDGEVTS